MVFSSMVFLGIFLPVVGLVYYLTPKKFRNLWLFMASLLFYGWGEPKYILIMLFSTVFDYVNGRLIGYFDAKGLHKSAGKAIVVLSCIGNLSILGFFKYTDFVIGSVNKACSTDFPLLEIALPIGISFYTFQTMSYTIDVYRGLVKPQKNIISFGMYVCLFPQLIAGPIVRYQDVAREVDERQESELLRQRGIYRFIIGLSKKVLLANQAGELYQQLQLFSGSELTAPVAWLSALMYTFQIYFDFSGYSDMAIGLGMFFGFHFPENFSHPYESASVTEFWRRWHMTLSTWFREYVYIPLGGNRKGRGRQILNLFVVWALTGLWHGADWNFLLWGLYYFLFLILEKLFLLRLFEKLTGKLGFLRHIYTMLVVVSGWVLFSHTDLSKALTWWKALFAPSYWYRGLVMFGAQSRYLWMHSLPFLLVMTVGCTGLMQSLWRRLIGGEESRVSYLCKREMGLSAILLVLSVIYLVSGSYNPFLYFRF
ncbi:alginate O-acetyltransferase complex protein AlgI [Lachnospiraceae bacterium KHCPX20]|nr:alginate O-acetyltransferase complex protein AlgI [Lachnospiraceae bacterium KHCPX20]